MRQKLKEKLPEKAVSSHDDCHHYWVIEAANGPTSEGRCRYCGKSQTFSNSMPDFNQLRRPPANKQNPFDLPEMEDVDVEEGSKS